MKLNATILAVLLSVPASGAARLKELVTLEGVRDNPLIGYGLVVGLNGTGDRRQTVFSAQSLASMLQQMGVTVSPNAMRVQNTASVMVTATLTPFARPGSRVDVNVAAIGDATSLQGGLLVLTSLRGVDGRVYSVAQGPVVLGGYMAGRGGNTRTMNHPTAGRIPSGAIVEQAPPMAALKGDLRLQLRQADFTTSARIAEAVNKRFGAPAPLAHADDSATVTVSIPPEFARRPTEFIAEMERLTVDADSVAKVVVNERTGTIVMGREVRILPVTVMHGALTVEVQTESDVSQPGPLSQGKTQVTEKTTVDAREEQVRNISLAEGTTVDDLVRSLSAIGATARDVIAILQSIQTAGALQAELEVI